MAATDIIAGTAWEDSGATVLARVTGGDGSNVTQADISSISYKVFDDAAEQATGSLTISNVIFDSLQTDNRWTKDNKGYNFRHTIAADTLSEPDKTYRVEYKFTPTGGEVFWVVAEIETKALRTS